MTARLRQLALGCIVAAAAPTTAAAQDDEGDRRSIVTGRVVDHATGSFLPRVEVTLTGPAPAADVETRVTADNGTFRFSDVQPGSYVVRLGMEGYASAAHDVDVSAAMEVRLVLRLSPRAIELAPLIAVTERRARFMEGFEERRAAATTHSAFFTHDEIQELNAKYITEVMWTVPGVAAGPRQLATQPGGGVLPMQSGLSPSGATDGRCMALFVNGNHIGGDVPYDEIYPPEDVAALEIYGLQHEVPAQFQLPGSCGALVVWLRNRHFSSIWKRLAAGLGIAGAIFLLTQ